jgi:hypothetical protein
MLIFNLCSAIFLSCDVVPWYICDILMVKHLIQFECCGAIHSHIPRICRKPCQIVKFIWQHFSRFFWTTCSTINNILATLLAFFSSLFFHLFFWVHMLFFLLEIFINVHFWFYCSFYSYLSTYAFWRTQLKKIYLC